MPPPARGCLRRDGHVLEGQAGVAGATPSRDVKKGVPAYDAKEATPGHQENRHHRRSTARSGGYGSAGMRGTQPKRFSSPAGRCRSPPRSKIRCICNCLILRHIPESRFPKYRNRLYGMPPYNPIGKEKSFLVLSPRNYESPIRLNRDCKLRCNTQAESDIRSHSSGCMCDKTEIYPDRGNDSHS